MEPVDNLASLHQEEERLRSEHEKLVASKDDLRDHVVMIREAMNIVWSLTHDHEHRAEDELTLQQA